MNLQNLLTSANELFFDFSLLGSIFLVFDFVCMFYFFSVPGIDTRFYIKKKLKKIKKKKTQKNPIKILNWLQTLGPPANIYFYPSYATVKYYVYKRLREQ